MKFLSDEQRQERPGPQQFALWLCDAAGLSFAMFV
jgi:hypothetical protein